MQTGLLVAQLPPGIYGEMGHVIHAYANLEHLISSTIHVLLGVSHKEGRLAVRQPRAPDRFTLVRDLLELNDIKLSFDLEALQDRIENCARQRDQLAHGIWLVDKEKTKFMLRLTKGSWQPVKGQRGKTKRLVSPEGVELGEQDIHALYVYIRHTAERVIELGMAIEGVPESLRRKHRVPPSRTSRHHGHTPSEPLARPEPSQG